MANIIRKLNLKDLQFNSELFPHYPFKSPNHQLKRRGDEEFVFDPIRKKELLLTPEETVRQAMVRAFNEHLNYPFESMSSEKGFQVGTRTKRPDILVFKEGKPALLVECKSPHVPIDAKVMEQIITYNSHFKLPWLLVSNGLVTIVMKHDVKNHSFKQMPDIPLFTELFF